MICGIFIFLATINMFWYTYTRERERKEKEETERERENMTKETSVEAIYKELSRYDNVLVICDIIAR